MPERRTIIRLDHCESTMDTARVLAEEGAADGTVVVADEQTGGRGTKGRLWLSPPGVGLYMTYILKPGDEEIPDLVLLPLASGLAGQEALAALGVAEARLKWPNDLVAGRRKLGGILCESVFQNARPSFALIGVGLNLNQTEKDFPPDLRPLATSVRLATGKEADRDAALFALNETLDRWLGVLREGRRVELLDAYEERLVFRRGYRIIVATAAGRAEFFYKGLTANGELRLTPAAEAGKGPERRLRAEDIEGLDWE
ncbi:MAG: biotin--[acetyl-CoA-carboxylase] ligase [Candidatus Aminicenantes bacterium]|nr:biotin--[acetyl-CoA-carboxylase] ligase [Candidatus Aminicenantes bacterium]